MAAGSDVADRFAQQVDAFVRKAGLRAATFSRKLGLLVYERVLVNSPVLTGRFRASWRIGIDGVDSSVEPPRTTAAEIETGAEPTGQELSYALGKLANLQFGQTVVVSNSLPYALPIEQGSSRKAPAGVLLKSVAEVQAKIAELARQVKEAAA